MSLLNDPEYIIHNLRIGYLRRLDDPYAGRIITFSPNVLSSNDYIKTAASSYPEMQECYSPSTRMLGGASSDYFDLKNIGSGNSNAVSPLSTGGGGGTRSKSLAYNSNNGNAKSRKTTTSTSGGGGASSNNSNNKNNSGVFTDNAESDDATDFEVEDTNKPHQHSFAKVNLKRQTMKTPPPVFITSPSKPPKSRSNSRHMVAFSYSPPLPTLKTSPESLVNLSSTEQTPILSPNSSPDSEKEPLDERRGSEVSMLTADEGTELPPESSPPKPRIKDSAAAVQQEFKPDPPIIIKRPKPFSALSALIQDQKSRLHNPFSEDYSFFAGKGDLNPIKIKIYLPFSTEKDHPLELIVKRDVTVEEVIGYTLYQYWDEKREPILDERLCNVAQWNMRIVEDDGEIDYDFPPLERAQKITKFFFDAYGLIEANPEQVIQNQQLQKTNDALSSNPKIPAKLNGDTSAPPSTKTDTSSKPNGIKSAVAPLPVDLSNQVFLRVRLTSSSEVAHTTMINVMAEQRLYDVLENVCRKRKLDSKEYTFKSIDKNHFLDLEKTIDSLGVNPELALVKKSNERARSDAVPPQNGSKSLRISRRTLEEPIYVSSTEYMSVYQKYTVNRKMPMFVGRHERSLAIDGDYIHIMPSESRTMFDSMKTSSYHISSVTSCKQDKKLSTNFKLVIDRESGNKTYDFEAVDARQAGEICKNIKFLSGLYKGEQSKSR
ncbi:9399_t:CDS:2 [Ambispora gerdemannii]|uniref:9399_t:CDS:1 n=1 Tax=Ambispora gerdemannii TaxID=144530 RepID=A0A9N9FNZ1_9GLOM|nr:9399_t:CDS:2 [Ambispora gerdemannii]